MPIAAARAQPYVALGSFWLGSLSLPCVFQVLECLDLSECGESVMKVSSRYLQSECRERRRLALRALLELMEDPSMVRRGQWLKLHWERSPLALPRLRELGQLLPALLPPTSAARVLRDRPLASRPCGSRVVFHKPCVLHRPKKCGA